MRRLGIVVMILGLSVTAFAKDHAWRQGKLIDTAQQREPLSLYDSSEARTTYRFEIEDERYIYVLSRAIEDRKFFDSFGQVPNLKLGREAKVTVNEPIKFAIEGDKAYILDEAGKEHKLRIEKRILKNSNKSSHQKDGESSSASARTAKVTITSETSGAEIELDGQFVGSTPTALDIAEGVHRITVRNGGKVWERNIRLSVGSSVAVNASFDQTSAPSTSQPPLTVTSPANQSRDTSKGGEPPASESVQPESNNDEATSSETGHANCGESLREVPVSSSKTGLKSLRCGEKVTILGRSGNWVRIRTADNVEGNVSSRFISQHQP